MFKTDDSFVTLFCYLDGTAISLMHKLVR